VTNRRGGTSPLVVAQTHVRHILIKFSEIVSEKDAMARIQGIKERLDHGEKFEDLARQYSDDGSAKSGGDLSWVNPGDTVPEFEKTMNALAPGEISSIIKTQFGLHVLQVIERIFKNLDGHAPELPAPGSLANHAILVAHDLSPADMVYFKDSEFAAFITDVGGATSHTAILGRSLDLPSVIALHHSRELIREDELVIVDGEQGVVIINPY
jgi:phosphohistidine swiveling domain-containing protein